MMLTADYLIKKLNLKPHPEGGYFREVYKCSFRVDGSALPPKFDGDRSLSSTIYFLLDAGQVSRFHRLKGTEIMFYHHGTPLHLHIIDKNGNYTKSVLGMDIEKGEEPQVILPAGTFFCGIPENRNDFSLVSTMVSPAFEYKDFELFKSREICEMFPNLREKIERLQIEDY